MIYKYYYKILLIVIKIYLDVEVCEVFENNLNEIDVEE